MKTNNSFWTYQAPFTPPWIGVLPEVFGGTEAEWESLSPGMRREIVRSAQRRKEKERLLNTTT